jgi:DNA-binding CsgD family transcriptional regulator
VTAPRSAPSLIGRDKETALLEDRLDRIGEEGCGLVIRGEAGVGKSAILEVARRYAIEHGLTVIATSGFQSEAHIAFAGLHQLLRPVLSDLDSLPSTQQSAMRAAFGQSESETADFFLVAMATLDLLSELATTAPLLVLVDDAQWLDVATSDVLAFVARRLELEPIVIVFGMLDEFAKRVDLGGLFSIELQPLDDADSAALLDMIGSDLAISVRQRILAEACGNPLALIELPLVAASRLGSSLSMIQPLTERLERAFTVRLGPLSSETRSLLLVAALCDDGNRQKLTSAASIVAGKPVGDREIADAITVRAMIADDKGLRFVHPLIRSAIYQVSNDIEHRAAHSALATAYSADRDRSMWHRAAALTGPDDEVSAGLEELAERAQRRGGTAVAVPTLQRAAQLSTDESHRAQLLLRAAWLAFELGQLDASNSLVTEAQQLELAQDERAVLLYMLEVIGQDTAWLGGVRIRPLIEIAEKLQAFGNTDRALDALEIASTRCWWGNPDQGLRDLVVAAAEGFRLPEDSPRLLAILAHADPVKQGHFVIGRVRQITPDALDPTGMYLVGTAASAVWAYDLALTFLAPAIAGFRSQRRLVLLARALVAQAWAAVHAAKEPLAVSATKEAALLAQETGQLQLAISAQLAIATICAERGDLKLAEEMAQQAEAQLLPVGATPMLALVQFVRGRGAVAHQHYEEGFEHLRRTLDPADPAFHPFIGAWGLSDLVEAAAYTGRSDEAEAYLAQLQSLAADTSGPLLQATTGYARPMVANDDDAEALYRRALDTDLVHWPCYRGRMLLWYGKWLRRQRRVSESRAPLRAAMEGFDALAFPELGNCARQELRAAGETPRQRTIEGWAELTPRELQIAQLAAVGQTNREIGQKLFVSHRTVEYHLHRIFPKLGIATRGHLSRLLAEEGLCLGERS